MTGTTATRLPGRPLTAAGFDVDVVVDHPLDTETEILELPHGQVGVVVVEIDDGGDGGSAVAVHDQEPHCSGLAGAVAALAGAVARPRWPRRQVGRARARRCPPPNGGHRLEESRRRPTLPGGYPPSTIGAGGLNCRVRNGNGCLSAAMATGNCALSGGSRTVTQPRMTSEPVVTDDGHP